MAYSRKLNGYFSLTIPYSDRPTVWHPADKVGPFAVLTRGAFPSEYLAHQWAFMHLQSEPYSVRFYSLAEDAETMDLIDD